MGRDHDRIYPEFQIFFGRNVVERHLSSASYFVFQIPDLQSAVSMTATLWSVFISIFILFSILSFSLSLILILILILNFIFFLKKEKNFRTSDSMVDDA